MGKRPPCEYSEIVPTHKDVGQWFSLHDKDWQIATSLTGWGLKGDFLAETTQGEVVLFTQANLIEAGYLMKPKPSSGKRPYSEDAPEEADIGKTFILDGDTWKIVTMLKEGQSGDTGKFRADNESGKARTFIPEDLIKAGYMEAKPSTETREYSEDAPTWDDIGGEFEKDGKTWKIFSRLDPRDIFPKGVQRKGFDAKTQDGHMGFFYQKALIEGGYMQPKPAEPDPLREPQYLGLSVLTETHSEPQYPPGCKSPIYDMVWNLDTHWREKTRIKGIRGVYLLATDPIRVGVPCRISVADRNQGGEYHPDVLRVQGLSYPFTLCNVPEGHYFWLIVPDDERLD